MATTQAITVRKATDDDCEAVLAINNNYLFGADYLVFGYKDLINDPDSTYYVCEVDGEIAAFEGVSLLDDNRTLMTRSARVKEQFQGKGLLNLIRKQVYEDYKDIPGEKRIRTCCTNVVRLVNSARFRSQNRTLGTRMIILYDPVEVLKLPTPYDSFVPGVAELDVGSLGIIFQNKQLVNYLFPDGFIEVMSWFYDPIISNIGNIKKLSPYISISAALEDSVKKLTYVTNAEPSQEKPQNDFVEDKNAQPQGLLSISSYYVTPSLIFFVFDMYGEPRQGYVEIDVHQIFYHSLQYAISVMEKEDFKFPIAVGFSINDTTVSEICKKLLTNLGFEIGEMGAFTHHYFFEQNFDKLLSE